MLKNKLIGTTLLALAIGTFTYIINPSFYTNIINTILELSCNICRNKRSNEDAKMLFLTRKQVCDSLLNRPFPFNTAIDTLECSQNCTRLDTDLDTTLVGYYIITQEELNTGSNDNAFVFYPIWLVETNSQVLEIISPPIILGPNGISNNDPIPPIYGNATIWMDSLLDGFNHNILQFHNLALDSTFERAYISRHQLLQITSNAEFVGIVGGTVQTGRIASSSPSDGLNATVSNNKEYFTYRLVGFNSASAINLTNSNEQNEYKMKSLVSKSNSVLLVKASLYKLSGNTPMFNISIPTEFFATPCPPMWYSSF
jgi:hypothetical protein